MKKYKSLCPPLIVLCALVLARPSLGQPPDISDSAVVRLMTSPFQYDYTRIVDDSTLRGFIDSLDYQFTVIEYRQIKELMVEPGSATIRKSYARELDWYYQEIFADRFLVKKLTDWKEKTSDPVNLSFINWFLDRNADQSIDRSAAAELRQLAERITDRLYKFHFRVNGEKYSATDAAGIIFSGDSVALARQLYRLINDSASVLADDAAKVYRMLNTMEQFRGYETALEYQMDRVSFEPSEWRAIADNLEEITRDEYFSWLDSLKTAGRRDGIPLFEIENTLTYGAVLPDSFFTPEAVKAALTHLLNSAGLSRVGETLRVRNGGSPAYLALAIRLCPPYDNLLLDSRAGGFAYYRRLAQELGRSLLWVYADSTLPFILRDYPPGSDEVFTRLFENEALKPEFLAEHFSIPDSMLKRFERNHRSLTSFQIRKSLLYFYFDYDLSQQIASDPAPLYMELQELLFGVRDSSHQWVEIVVTGGLESVMKDIANTFTWIKTVEMLHRRFGEVFCDTPDAGRFLIEHFCRPGRSQTIETYINAHVDDRLSAEYFKRVMQFR